MDATDKVRLVIDSVESAYLGTQLLVKEYLRVNGRFQFRPDHLNIEYDQEIGQAVRDWFGRVNADNPAAVQLWGEFLGLVEWSTIGRDLHNEAVKEAAEKWPEWDIRLPQGMAERLMWALGWDDLRVTIGRPLWRCQACDHIFAVDRDGEYRIDDDQPAGHTILNTRRGGYVQCHVVEPDAPKTDNGQWFTCGECHLEIKYLFKAVPSTISGVSETYHEYCH